MSSSIVIVSGYFNPLHVGHINLMTEALKLGGRLGVIVNNDDQQLLKKGRIIMSLEDRLTVVRAIGMVSEAYASIDEDTTVRRSLEAIRGLYPDDAITFANGGDRSRPELVPEYETCLRYNIEMRFGIGGKDKADSSSRINQALESS